MANFEAAAQHYNHLHADDDLETYEPHKRERILLEQYTIIERKFNTLTKELHIPFLDVKLYRKYFVSQKSEQNLTSLLAIVQVLQEHKEDTLRLLGLIFEREQIVNVIKVMAMDYGKGKLSTLEVQTKVLQLLYSLQQVTLRIVEGIQEWRNRLTRPYAFEWRGINYIFKVIKDCQFIDTCDLSAVLPLQLNSHPLCSNLNTLNLFGPHGAGGVQSGGSIAITYPMKATKKAMIPHVTTELLQRLQRAEVVVFSEHNLQVNLVKELAAINRTGAFLTVLDIKAVVPNCCDGIRVNNKVWDQRLGRALGDTFRKLQSRVDATGEEGFVSDGDAEDDGGDAGGTAAAPAPEEEAAAPTSAEEEDEPPTAEGSVSGAAVATPTAVTSPSSVASPKSPTSSVSGDRDTPSATPTPHASSTANDSLPVNQTATESGADQSQLSGSAASQGSDAGSSKSTSEKDK